MPKDPCSRTPRQDTEAMLAKIGRMAADELNAAEIAHQTFAVRRAPLRNTASLWQVTQAPPPIEIPMDEAVSYLVAYEPSANLRRDLALQWMNQFYQFAQVPLALPEDCRAANLLAAVRDNDLAFCNRAEVPAKFEAFWTYMAFVGELVPRLNQFVTAAVDLGPAMADLPCLDQAAAICANLTQFLATNLPPTGNPVGVELARTAVRRSDEDLARVFAILQSTVQGFAVVTENRTVPEFYLLRLLVPYEIGPGGKLDKKYGNIASSLLTAFLNNSFAPPQAAERWLAELMPGLVGRLAAAIADVGGDRVSFFVKGGRGMACLLGNPAQGENDWDTQLLIDPGLSVVEWNDLYGRLRAAIVNCLAGFNLEFSANLTAHLSALDASLEAFRDSGEDKKKILDGILNSFFELTQQDNDDDDRMAVYVAATEQDWEALANRDGRSCKAELIDVGVARYYTVELLNQWRMVRPTVRKRGDLPCPGSPYFIDEFITMIRECDLGVSPSPAKRTKRLGRLTQLLGSGVEDLAPFIDHEADFVQRLGLTACREAIQAIPANEAKFLATVLLSQFATAYRCADDPNLTAAFDAWAAARLGALQLGQQGNLPVPAQIEAVFKWTDGVSRGMAKHLNYRGYVLCEAADAIVGLTGTACERTAPCLPVATGAFAAFWYKSKGALGDTRNQLDPVEFAVMEVFFPDCSTAGDVTEKKFAPFLAAVKEYIGQDSPRFGATVGDADHSIVRVFASQDIALGDRAYKPLLMEFRLLPGRLRLSTTRIDGLDLRPLEFLQAEYRSRAAEVVELVTRGQLVGAIGALIEMELAAKRR